MTPFPDNTPPPNARSAQTLGLVGTTPVELAAAAFLIAAPTVYMLVHVALILPDIFDLLSNWGRVGFYVLWLVVVIVAACTGFIAIGVLVFRADRLGRGLTFIAAVAWMLATIAAEEVDTPTIVYMICLLAAAVIIAVAPGAVAAFRASPAGLPPTSIRVARVTLQVGAVLVATVGLAFLVAFAGTGLPGTGKYVALGVIQVIALPAGLIAAERLSAGDVTTRRLASLVAVALFILGLALGAREFGAILGLSLWLLIPVCLWLTPDARDFFGDSPLGTPTPARTSGGVAARSANRPIPPAAPVSAGMGQERIPRVCGSCGALVADGASFCKACGVRYVAPTCPGCRAPSPEGQLFCTHCGAQQRPALTSRCRECGTEVEPTDRFCPACGASANLDSLKTNQGE